MPYARPIKVSNHFSSEDMEELRIFVRDNVKSIDSKLMNFRNEKLPEMVKVYKGVPKQAEADFPWPGAANLVIQLVGTFVDELLSRVMAAIYQYDPLFTVWMQGDNEQKTADELKKIIEKFLMDEAYDPSALDLYRAEQAMFNSVIKYGTGILEFPWEYKVEKEIAVMGGSLSSTPEHNFKDTILRNSPRPRLVPLNKFGIDPGDPVLGEADFFYTIETLKYNTVKNLKYLNGMNELISETDFENIKNNPDRANSAEMQETIKDIQGMEGYSDRYGAEWDFYNCYIRYKKGNETYSILAKYHKRSETLLWSVFNNNPGNIFPVEDAKLGYDDEQYFGTGYAQMLRTYQKELSQNSNWRTNNRNFAMMGIMRVDPDSKLSSVLQMYPGVMIPAKEGAVEVFKSGADVGYASEPDQFIMSCAKERAGVDPAISGTGGGLVNNKRGIYSASGTSMMLIQQNNRNNLRMSDMRSAHMRMGIKFMQMYSNIGIQEKLRKYGSNADKLKAAFDAFKSGSLGFRIRPTDASNNKELNRQNDILLAGALERFYMQNAQMLQALTNPQCPPPLKDYYSQVLIAGTALYREILINFNKDNTAQLLPDIKGALNLSAGGGGNQGANQGANPPVQGNIGPIPNGGVQGPAQIPV